MWKIQYNSRSLTTLHDNTLQITVLCHQEIMESHLLETLPAESEEFAALLSSEQLERVMQS
eukprot:10713882-Karenia_brevis.AAC.1